MNKEELEKGMKLIKEISDLQKKILEGNSIFNNHQRIIETTKRSYMSLIRAEKLSTGKFKYSNNEARQTRLHMLLIRDDKYKKNKRGLDMIENEKEIRLIDLERLRNEFELFKLINN